MTDAGKIMRLTLPLTPVLRKGASDPVITKRLRPADSLNLHGMIAELRPGTLTTLNVCGYPWSVIAVYSPYSPEIHVMLMETSPDRYLPAPNALPDEEGEGVAQIIGAVLSYIGDRAGMESVYFGYNWSPRSWGEVEEQGGFQSIPTKWHAMLWGWPSFSRFQAGASCADWISRDKLGLPARRIFGEAAYMKPLSRVITERLQAHDPIRRAFFRDCGSGGSGAVCTLKTSLLDTVTEPAFFSSLLKPAAGILDGLFAELTELFTDIDCGYMDSVLKSIENGPVPPHVLKNLRSAPQIRPETEVKKKFLARGFPEDLFQPVYQAVSNRAALSKTHAEWWRKGFGYALVFSDTTVGDHCMLRILPGLYVGPGGIVEAQGVYLKRRLDQVISPEEMREKSGVLWKLADHLNSRFTVYSERE